MIKLKKVYIESYKLFLNADLDLQQLSGLITLLGINEDLESFSSNSVGKSTFIDSILTCLYGKNLAGDALEYSANLYTGKKPSITLELLVNENEYIIINDYSLGILQVYKNGVKIDLVKKKDLFEYIENELGLSYFLFKNLVYLSPNSTSIFSLNDSALQNKFITELLNLDFITDINKKASVDLKSLKGDLQLKIKEQSIYHTQIETAQKQLALLPEVVKMDYQPEIDSLSGQKYEIELYIKSQKKVREKVSSEFDKLKDRSTELRTEKKLVEQELKKKVELIKLGRCPHCDNVTNNIECHSDETRLSDVQIKLDEVTEQGMKVKAELIEIEADIKQHNQALTEVQAKLDEIQRKKEALIASEAQRGARLILQAQLEDNLEKMIELQSEITLLEDDKYILELLVQCTSSKGFSKERISLFLHLYNIEIKALAKKLLGSSQRVNIVRDDNSKFFLEIFDGDVTLSYNLLSSGFKSRIDIILILALNKTVETLTGISLNLLVLDEVLSSLDTEGIQATQDLLIKIQHMFPEKLIFVVSHNQSLRFDNTLTIHRANNSSKFIINGE